MFFLAILIPASASSSLALHKMYSTYKLNKPSDNIQPWHTPFPILNQSVVPCPVLTIASWPAYRFLRRQVRWYAHLFYNFPQFVVIHTVKDFTIVNEGEVDVFLEFSCFFYDPMNVSNMISNSSAFPKSRLNIWRFYSCTVEASLGEFCALLCKCVKWVQLCSSLSILWHCFSLELEWKLTFSSPVATAEFSKCAGILSVAL